jgi:hypothetical protein
MPEDFEFVPPHPFMSRKRTSKLTPASVNNRYSNLVRRGAIPSPGSVQFPTSNVRGATELKCVMCSSPAVNLIGGGQPQAQGHPGGEAFTLQTSGNWTPTLPVGATASESDLDSDATISQERVIAEETQSSDEDDTEATVSTSDPDWVALGSNLGFE